MDSFNSYIFVLFFCDSQPMSELFMPAIRYILYTLHIIYIYNRFIINNMKMKFNKNIKRTKPIFLLYRIWVESQKNMRIILHCVALIYPCIIVPVFDDDILFIFQFLFICRFFRSRRHSRLIIKKSERKL